MISLSNALAVAWFVIGGVVVIAVGLSFLLNSRVINLFKRYGSTVLPDVIDLVSVNTPSAGLRLQKYFLTRAYEKETQPELRSVGKVVRTLTIIALALIVLFLAVTVLAIWVAAS